MPHLGANGKKNFSRKPSNIIYLGTIDKQHLDGSKKKSFFRVDNGALVSLYSPASVERPANAARS